MTRTCLVELFPACFRLVLVPDAKLSSEDIRLSYLPLISSETFHFSFLFFFFPLNLLNTER